MASAIKRASKNRSLSGLCVLVGRARHQAGALSKELRSRGARVLEIPFIEIRHPRSYTRLDNALRNIREYDWLILTSVNGVDALAGRMKRLKIGKRQFDHLQTAAIGPATKKATEKRGVRVDVVPEEYVAESVVKSLKHSVQGKRVLLIRAKVARDVIPRELRKAGGHVDVVEAYETVIPRASGAKLQAALRSGSRPNVITFTSSSTANHFAALLGKLKPRSTRRRPRLFAETLFASIGPVTSATLRKLGLPVDVEADPSTIPGLVQAIESATFATHL
jgi:uroporphyrinogen-III synthase